jgi:hypothetical protein
MRQWQNYFREIISRIGGWGTNTKIIKTETVLHLNLGHFVVFFSFLLFCFIWFFPSLMRQWQNSSETPTPGLEAEGLMPKLLRLKLYCIWTWRFFYYLFYFIFSILSLSNACSAYCVLISTLYLPVYIFETFLFVFFYLFICFSLFNSFAFPLLSPFHSKYHHCYYYKLENI